MEAKLVVVYGQHRGREIRLPPTIFVIGRDPKCHLRPHCAAVSRLHCAVACWAGRVYVRDMKSANGTFLNGERIRGQVIVGDGDVLKVGALEFEFKLNTQEPEPTEPRLTVEEVEWLLRAPTDSDGVDPGATTSVVPAFGRLADQPEGAEMAMTGRAAAIPLSAGQYLRDYLNKPMIRGA